METVLTNDDVTGQRDNLTEVTEAATWLRTVSVPNSWVSESHFEPIHQY